MCSGEGESKNSFCYWIQQIMYQKNSLLNKNGVVATTQRLLKWRNNNTHLLHHQLRKYNKYRPLKSLMRWLDFSLLTKLLHLSCNFHILTWKCYSTMRNNLCKETLHQLKKEKHWDWEIFLLGASLYPLKQLPLHQHTQEDKFLQTIMTPLLHFSILLPREASNLRKQLSSISHVVWSRLGVITSRDPQRQLFKLKDCNFLTRKDCLTDWTALHIRSLPDIPRCSIIIIWCNEFNVENGYSF
jgi:hypothetical protein